MDVGLSFGSVGDIIAVCQLIVELSKALDDATGSAAHYREIRNELDDFVSLLMQVVAIYEQHESSPSMRTLDNEIRHVVKNCAEFIAQVSDRLLLKYHPSLAPGGSGNVFKDAAKKLQFHMFDRHSLAVIRDQFAAYTRKITFLMVAALRKTARVDSVTMLARVQQVENLIQSRQDYLLQLHSEYSSALQGRSEQLHRLEENLETQQQHFVGMSLSLGNALKALQEIKEMLAQIANTLHLYITAPISFRFIDPTLGKPVVLETSLGELWDIPTNWIHEWDMFEVLLAHRFENRRGHSMVLRKQFALEESCSGADIERHIPWSVAIRPGMKINMSMVFPKDSKVLEECPRCKTKLKDLKRINVECPNSECKMVVREVETWFMPLDSSDNGGATAGTITANLAADAMFHFQRVRLVTPTGETMPSSEVSSIRRTPKTNVLTMKNYKMGYPKDEFPNEPTNGQ